MCFLISGAPTPLLSSTLLGGFDRFMLNMAERCTGKGLFLSGEMQNHFCFFGRCVQVFSLFLFVTSISCLLFLPDKT
jgi:hypothetical protein